MGDVSDIKRGEASFAKLLKENYGTNKYITEFIDKSLPALLGQEKFEALFGKKVQTNGTSKEAGKTYYEAFNDQGKLNKIAETLYSGWESDTGMKALAAQGVPGASTFETMFEASRNHWQAGHNKTGTSSWSSKDVVKAVQIAGTVASAYADLGGAGALGQLGNWVNDKAKNTSWGKYLTIGTFTGGMGNVFGANGVVGQSGFNGLGSLLNGSADSNTLLGILTSDSTATNAQKAFIKAALRGGLTAEQVTRNKNFMALQNANLTDQTAAAKLGLQAFNKTMAEMQAESNGPSNGVVQAETGANKALADATAGVSTIKPNEKAMGEFNKNADNIGTGLQNLSQAYEGLASSYGFRNADKGIAGTSIGTAPGAATYNAARGVSIGDQTTALQKQLEKRIADARAAGASPAVIAELTRRGQAELAEMQRRTAIEDERSGNQALIQASQAFIPFYNATTSNANAMATIDLQAQEMRQQFQNQLAQLGLSNLQIQAQMDQFDKQLQLSRQQALMSGSLDAYKASLDAMANTANTLGTALTNDMRSGVEWAKIGVGAAQSLLENQQKQRAAIGQNIGNQPGAAGQGGMLDTSSWTDFAKFLEGQNQLPTSNPNYEIPWGGTGGTASFDNMGFGGLGTDASDKNIGTNGAVNQASLYNNVTLNYKYGGFVPYQT